MAKLIAYLLHWSIQESTIPNSKEVNDRHKPLYGIDLLHR